MNSGIKFYSVDGYLVGYEHNYITDEIHPLAVEELRIIPPIFEFFILENLDKYFGTGRYNLQWKQTLSFEESRCYYKHTINRYSFMCSQYEFDLSRDYEDFRASMFQIGIDKFTKEYQRLTPAQIQEARKYIILDSDGVPAVPADSIPAAPAVVPVVAAADSAPGVVPTVAADPVPAVAADPVPAVAADPDLINSIPSVKWEFAEIQGSVRDSKRENSLTELKKQTSLLEQIAENTSSGNAKPKTRLETLQETYSTYCKTVNQNTARYLMREKQNCSYEEIWKIEHWGEDWDAVDIEFKRQEIANIRAGVSQARPKRS